MLRNLFQERRRSAAVRALAILRTPAEPAFDAIVENVAAAFDAPIALLSFFAGDTQWFKACRGLDMECIPRSDSICNFVLDQPDLLECCDLRDDMRFAAMDAVQGAPHVSYYIGVSVPLLNGTDVGVLCVADTKRRDPASDDQRAYLRGLARQTSIMIEARSDIRRRGVAA